MRCLADGILIELLHFIAPDLVILFYTLNHSSDMFWNSIEVAIKVENKIGDLQHKGYAIF
jgi:hypothetical protein